MTNVTSVFHKVIAIVSSAPFRAKAIGRVLPAGRAQRSHELELQQWLRC